MGRKQGTSWFTAVKRAFRSPTKDADKRRTRESQGEEEEEKKREKRRWIFRKLIINTSPETVSSTRPALPESIVCSPEKTAGSLGPTRNPSDPERTKQQSAAIVIQTVFRGYLARRALRALKGLVKLQALVRGHNVRKQAKMTLRCMQALLRVQARVLDQRMKLSQDGSSRKSLFSDTNSLWESRYLQEISERKSMSTEEPGHWSRRHPAIDELKALLECRKEDLLNRERCVTEQMSEMATDQRPTTEEGKMKLTRRLGRLTKTRAWENSTSRRRVSTDQTESIKTLEIDTSQPYSFSGLNPSVHHRSPVTLCPEKSPSVQEIRPGTPRWTATDTEQLISQTPRCRRDNGCAQRSAPAHLNSGLPNYMAATESARAKARSQSAPKQRSWTLAERERGGSAKKRLSFPAPDPFAAGSRYGYNLKSPSFKSVGASYTGMEQQSNYSSCCTDSLGGEISPYSTGELRSWMIR